MKVILWVNLSSDETYGLTLPGASYLNIHPAIDFSFCFKLMLKLLQEVLRPCQCRGLTLQDVFLLSLFLIEATFTLVSDSLLDTTFNAFAMTPKGLSMLH